MKQFIADGCVGVKNLFGFRWIRTYANEIKRAACFAALVVGTFFGLAWLGAALGMAAKATGVMALVGTVMVWVFCILAVIRGIDREYEEGKS